MIFPIGFIVLKISPRTFVFENGREQIYASFKHMIALTLQTDNAFMD